MREEIFGPLLPLLPYDDVKDAIDFVNAQPSPLAMYWFDENRERTEWALKESHAGGMCVNETLMHIAQEELPFGGVGPSGMGHYHGEWGFETFSKLTPVFRQSRFNGMSLFMPPYKPHVQDDPAADEAVLGAQSSAASGIASIGSPACTPSGGTAISASASLRVLSIAEPWSFSGSSASPP